MHVPEFMKISRPFYIFYILVAYIFIQFAWWGYHIATLNSEIFYLKLEAAKITTIEPAGKDELIQKLHRGRWMVIGEGSVFFIFLLMGVYITQKAFKKEVALSNQQKNFLMSITHELKSPLASIKLYLQTLQKHELEKPKRISVLNSALNDTERLSGLVDNILLATQIESGLYPLQKEPVNLSLLITGIMDKVIKLYSKGEGGELEINLRYDIEPGLFMIADSSAMSSIVNNLIENAVKYSDADSEIFLELKAKDHNALLRVYDKGMGIDEKLHTRVFEKFYRTENEGTRKTRGTGLGLFIVKYLVEQHNGRICIKNNQPKGSIFEVRFTAIS